MSERNKEKSVQKEDAEEAKKFIADKLADFEKKKAVIDFQLKTMKQQNTEDNGASAAWTGQYVCFMLSELGTLYEAVGEIAQAIDEMNTRLDKLDGEWHKKNAVIKQTLSKNK